MAGDEKLDLHRVLGYAKSGAVVATQEEMTAFMDYYGGSKNHPNAEKWEAALEDCLFVVDCVSNLHFLAVSLAKVSKHWRITKI